MRNTPKSELIPVPPWEVDILWPQVGPLIEKALKRSGGRIDIEACRFVIRRGEMNLWTAWVDDELVGVAVTEIVIWPEFRALRWVAVAGKDFTLWREHEEAISAWAKRNGCVRAEVIGRRGWARRLGREWKEAATLHEREL